MNQAPEPPSKLELSRSGGYSALTLAVTALSSLSIGIAIGIVLMMLLGPPPAAPAEEAAETEDETEEEETEPEPSASASATAAPTVDAAAQARFRKLQELRKKIKGQRSKDMDAQCKKHFKTKLPAGYVYQGGRFEENQLVAGSSGCAPLAKATKAPWFCCPR